MLAHLIIIIIIISRFSVLYGIGLAPVGGFVSSGDDTVQNTMVKASTAKVKC